MCTKPCHQSDTAALGGAGSITQAISDETTYALGILLPDVTKEWTSITWMPFATDLVSRISAKVFLGEPLCRNNDWLHISVMYTVNSFNAARTLRSWPPFLRPLVHLLKPEFKELQKQLADARRIINPEVEKRKRARREAIAAGQKPSKAADAIEWMLEQAKDQDYDVAMGQVMLAIAAIHTTSGMLSALLWHLAAAPEYIDELRKEIAQVFTEDGGFKKTSLYKMRLLDSCMKEAQRLHTISASKFIYLRRFCQICFTGGGGSLWEVEAVVPSQVFGKLDNTSVWRTASTPHGTQPDNTPNTSTIYICHGRKAFPFDLLYSSFHTNSALSKTRSPAKLWHPSPSPMAPTYRLVLSSASLLGP